MTSAEQITQDLAAISSLIRDGKYNDAENACVFLLDDHLDRLREPMRNTSKASTRSHTAHHSSCRPIWWIRCDKQRVDFMHDYAPSPAESKARRRPDRSKQGAGAM